MSPGRGGGPAWPARAGDVTTPGARRPWRWHRGQGRLLATVVPPFHIAPDETASGRLCGTGDVRVEGRLTGEVEVCGEVRVMHAGAIEGPVRATRAVVEGRIDGDVTAAQEVRVGEGGVISGNVRAPAARIEAGGRIEGTLSFDAPGEASAPEPVALTQPRQDGAALMPRVGRRRGRFRGGPAALMMLALLSTACARQALSLHPEPRVFTPDDYSRVYDAWTRDSRVFSVNQLSDTLHVTATFESWEFRWAYVIRYAHDYAIDPATRDSMLRSTLADASQNHRFFVSMAGQRFRESDLTNKLSAWRVLLVDEQGNQTVPAEIEKIRRPGPVERIYFPSVSPYRLAFRITFPARRADGNPVIPPDAGRVVLRFTGVHGQVDLTWAMSG
jgi:cytoskeletal protein CcmA (bactofilin family)